MWSWCGSEKELTSQKPLGTQFESANYIIGKPCARGRDTKVSQTQIVRHNLVCTNGQRDNFRTMLCVLLCLQPSRLCIQPPCVWFCLWHGLRKIAECWVLSACFSVPAASGCVCVIYDPWPCRLQNVYTGKWPVIRASHVMCFIVCSSICILK